MSLFKVQVRQVCAGALVSSGLIAVTWPHSVQLGKPQPCLPVLLWVSHKHFMFQRLNTVGKGSESYLLSTSCAGFSKLFLFCFESEWKVPDCLIWPWLGFCTAVPTGEMPASHVSSCSHGHEEQMVTASFSSAL